MTNIQNPKFKIQRGFTLTEILIVIGIIVVLIGISIPVFRQFQPTLQLSGAVRTLVTNLRYAQQLAVTEQVNHCLQLFLTERKYQIIQCDQTEPLLEITLPDEISSFSATGFTSNKIEFNPYGAVKEKGDITLKNTEGKAKTIDVRPSGFVKITD